MGPGLRARRMPAGVFPRPGSSVEPLAADCLEVCLREQADFSVAEDASPRVLLLASRMPVPKPDALNWSRIQLACFWRELSAICLGASLALEVTRISSKFLLIFSSRIVSFALRLSMFSGLQLFVLQASENLVFFWHFDFDTDTLPAQKIADVRARCTLWTAV